MVTEDRKEFGFVPNMSSKENITLSSLGRFAWGPFIRPRAEARAADEQMRRMGASARPDQAVLHHVAGDRGQSQHQKRHADCGKPDDAS